MSEQEVHQALVLWHFQREVKRQCDFCLKAFRELETAAHSYKSILGSWPHETIHDEGVVEGSEEAYLRQLKDYEEEQAAKQSINEHEIAIWFSLQNILVSIPVLFS